MTSKPLKLHLISHDSPGYLFDPTTRDPSLEFQEKIPFSQTSGSPPWKIKPPKAATERCYLISSRDAIIWFINTPIPSTNLNWGDWRNTPKLQNSFYAALFFLNFPKYELGSLLRGIPSGRHLPGFPVWVIQKPRRLVPTNTSLVFRIPRIYQTSGQNYLTCCMQFFPSLGPGLVLTPQARTSCSTQSMWLLYWVQLFWKLSWILFSFLDPPTFRLIHSQDSSTKHKRHLKDFWTTPESTLDLFFLAVYSLIAEEKSWIRWKATGKGQLFVHRMRFQSVLGRCWPWQFASAPQTCFVHCRSFKLGGMGRGDLYTFGWF